MSNADNKIEEIKNKIREVLGDIDEDTCPIQKIEDTYVIKPKNKLWLHIDSVYDVDSTRTFRLFKYELIFDHCIFECEISLEAPIDKKVTFKNCIFKNPIFFYTTLKNGLVFQDTTFEKIVRFTRSSFEAVSKFSNCIFQNEADFSNCIFSQKADFAQTIFKASAYFDSAKFKSYAIFKQSEFCENAHFYQTEFSENPDFFQATFNEHLNLTDANIHNEYPNIADIPIFNFDFEGLKEEAQTCSEADKYRDVFKNIKNALIKSSNLLGASRFRKMELYCKEIELDLKKKENKESNIRDTTDRIQLMFYRLTSDHHTDLLLILNNVIFLIALFGVANLVLLLNQCDVIQLAFLKINYIKLLEISICTIYIILIICAMLKCCSVIYLVIFLPIFSLIFYLFPTYAMFMILTFCVLILCLMPLSCFQSKLKENLAKQCIFGMSYFIVILMLIFKPSLLIPILGKLVEDKSYETCHCNDFDIFGFCPNTTSFVPETLNFIYMLFLFLLLFSLQKTARKNTIVPN